MSALATPVEVLDALTREIATAEARLARSTDTYIREVYLAEIRIKRSAVLLLGGEDPTIVEDKIEAGK